MRAKTVYLAGKMTGLSIDEMNGWRNVASDLLEANGFRVLNPAAADICDETEAMLVVTSNVAMIDEADIILMELTAERHEVSIGTIAELGYAYAKGKPVVAFRYQDFESEEPEHIDHPWIVGTVRKVTTTVYNACDAITRMYPTVRGGNA